MPKEVIRFKCDYCKKHYSTIYSARKHEKRCIFNPEVKACLTCKHSYYYNYDKAGCRKRNPDSMPIEWTDANKWLRNCIYHEYQGFAGIDIEEEEITEDN